eukprot:GHVU01067448.1.p1 GENE.GHVU01067448.1~~GHVU01067448.1.p1  ORF type:complete len:122 (+),score=10.44 GHVU01067448.1:52-366(+)
MSSSSSPQYGGAAAGGGRASNRVDLDNFDVSPTVGKGNYRPVSQNPVDPHSLGGDVNLKYNVILDSLNIPSTESWFSEIEQRYLSALANERDQLIQMSMGYNLD